MEFAWSAEEEQYRADIMTFLQAEVPAEVVGSALELASQWRADFSKQFAAKLAERHWLTPSWPRAYGGTESTAWQQMILAELMVTFGEPRGNQYMNVNWIGPAIILAGTPEQKSYHLSRISRGDVLWCQGFSEPEAGSDLASMRTRAERDGDEYIVNGEKIWTSYANVAEFCFLLVRTDPAAEQHRGISILLVPMDTPGLEVRDLGCVVGAHSIHHLVFTDMRVPASIRLGPENEGWPIVRHALAYERVGIPRYARSAANLDRVLAQARARGRLDPGLCRLAAQARAACEAARVLAYRVIDERAKGQGPGLNTNLARVAIISAERLVGSVAAQLAGMAGLEEGTTADQQQRNALTGGLTSGSYELQLNLIARHLGLPRS
jgi:alkylation response protein AidB-like acyl-CoA dehydrogenase